MKPVDDGELGPAARRALIQPYLPERPAGRLLGGESPNQVCETALGRSLGAGKQEIAPTPVFLLAKSRCVQ